MACASIRGYMYQLNTTVLAWVSIQENQTIYIEGNEDMDIVSKIGDANEELETVQVKNMEEGGKTDPKALTLTSAFDSIIYVSDLLGKATPGCTVTARYVTTQPIGNEKPPVVKKKSGIRMWINFSTASKVEKGKLKEYLKMLATKKGEAGAQLLKTLTPESGLEKLVAALKWDVQDKLADDMTENIVKKLVAKHELRDDTGKLVCDALFGHVVSLINMHSKSTLDDLEKRRVDAAGLRTVIQLVNKAIEDHAIRTLPGYEAVLKLREIAAKENEIIAGEYLAHCKDTAAVTLAIADGADSSFTNSMRASVCSGLGSSQLRAYRFVAGPHKRETKKKLAAQVVASLTPTVTGSPGDPTTGDTK